MKTLPSEFTVMPGSHQGIGPWFGERLALAAARDVERGCGTVTPIGPR